MYIYFQILLLLIVLTNDTLKLTVVNQLVLTVLERPKEREIRKKLLQTKSVRSAKET